MNNISTQIIYDVFDDFKQYVSQTLSFSQWKDKLEQYFLKLEEAGEVETDRVLTDCILRMFYRGAVEIEHKQYEWKETEITVKFQGKEYKTTLPLYDFGVFKNTPVSDHFYRAMIYSKMINECSKVYDKFLPSAVLEK